MPPRSRRFFLLSFDRPREGRDIGEGRFFPPTRTTSLEAIWRDEIRAGSKSVDGVSVG